MTVIASTALDVIKKALKTAGVLGIGQSPKAEDVNDALQTLNWMLGEWQAQRWLVYRLDTVGVESTGAGFYTIGPGGAFNVPSAPDRLEAAFCRQTVPSQPNQVDYPLELIQSRETYNNIALKSLTSFPSYVFYESGFPLGKIYPYPLPQVGLYSVFVSIKAELSAFGNLTDLVQFPAAYYAAIYWNLVTRLRSEYNMPADPQQLGFAKGALSVVRGSNTAIARLTMPEDLVRSGIYNPYSDQIR